MHPLIKKWHKRRFSWSQKSSYDWNKKQWFDRYILEKKSPATPELDFGKIFGSLLEVGDNEHNIERLGIPEYEILTKYKKIPLIGYLDSWDAETKTILEYKTGVKLWDKKRVDDHGQLTFYAALLYLAHKIRPEDVTMRLIWCATEKVHGETVIKELPNGEMYESQDYSIKFIENMTPRVFATKRTSVEVLRFLGEIERQYADMEAYALGRLQGMEYNRDCVSVDSVALKKL